MLIDRLVLAGRLPTINGTVGPPLFRSLFLKHVTQQRVLSFLMKLSLKTETLSVEFEDLKRFHLL